MYEIAVVHEAPRPTWSTRRLLKAIRSYGYKATYVLIQYLSGCIHCNCNVLYRGRCFVPSAAILRSLGRFPTVETMLKRINTLNQLAREVPVVNNPQSLLLARDKYASLKILSNHGIPVPRTLVTEDPYEALKFIENVGSVVIKPLSGTMGLGSFRVDDPDTAYRILTIVASLKQPIYVQEYVKKKGNRDIRVFVVDGEAVAAAFRIAKPGSWKTNVAQGARTEPAPLPEDVREIAVKATEALNLCYAGVDIAEREEGGYVVFEVNASPLWRGLYEATGIDPAPYIVKAVVESLKRGEGCAYTSIPPKTGSSPSSNTVYS